MSKESCPRLRRGRGLVLVLGVLPFWAPVAGAQSAILWDSHHGIYSSFYTLGTAYTKFDALLTGLGYSIVQSDVGVLNQDLSQFDVLLVSATSAAHSAYSAPEIAKIQAFVQAGGGLLLLGENSEIPSVGLNSLGAAFGMKFNTNKVFPSDTFVTNLSTHDMFQGIQSVYLRYGGEIEVSVGAVVVGTTATNQDMIAVSTAGRVVGLGDANGFDDTFLHQADNVAYVGKLFDHLMGGCVTDLGPGLAGSGGIVPRIELGAGVCGGFLTLELAGALGGAPSLLLAGTQSAAIPAAGGTVYVDVTSPPVLVLPLPLGGAAGQPGQGFALVAQNLTPYLPLGLTFQFAVFDGLAPYGVALSNGVRVDMAP